MKRHWMVFVAAMTAFGITACGNGDGIVINGTTAAEEGGGQEETSGQVAQETRSGTMIEIVTDETTSVPETAAQSTEGYSQEVTQPATAPETTAAPQTAASTQASVPQTTAAQTASATRPAVSETTAATTYKVTDVKKTMYATASVRVRSSYSTSSSVLAGLAEGEKVEVTGESENGWLRVNYKGNVGYVSKSYLTEQVPESASQLASAGQNSGGSASGTSGSSSNQTSQGGTTASSGSGTTTSDGKVGPGGSGSTGTGSSGAAVGPGGSGGQTGQGSGGTGPSVSESSAAGNSSSAASGNSVTGSVTALDPTGVTIQTSNGTTYQFIWGSDVPALAPGEKIQIFYETTSTGERRVTSYSK